VTKNTDWT